MAKKNKRRGTIGFRASRFLPGYRDLLAAVATHAPTDKVCFINSEWDEDEAVRMARCNGYEDFHLVEGHYQLVEGEVYFQDLGTMVFIDRAILAGDDLLDYR